MSWELEGETSKGCFGTLSHLDSLGSDPTPRTEENDTMSGGMEG